MATEEIIVNYFEEEWEDFQPTQVLSADISGKLWNSINKNVATPGPGYSFFRWMAAAASVLLVVGLSWLFLIRQQRTISVGASAVAVPKENILNRTPQKRTLTLSDGSSVELLSNSTLSYPADFNAGKRDVILINGEANFNITKDLARPFTVYINPVLITVLGTRFTVRSDETKHATKVILQEGRIMVKICDSSTQDNKREYYLDPGDVFIFRKVNAPSRAVNTDRIVTPGAPKNISGDSLPVHILRLEKDKNGCYAFDNCPLDVVFDQLQIIYDAKIIYNKAELGNHSFIGKIDKRDSLYHILNSIALLNNFTLHRQGDGFIISN